MHIGEIIRQERIRKNLKQYELAEKAGISNTYLSDMENGRTTPSIKTLKKLAKVLGIECSKLLDTE